MSQQPTRGSLPLDEAAIVARVTRYSSLRGVERALLPSVRRRIRLPTTRLGTSILTRLQTLLEWARAHTPTSVQGFDDAVGELAAVDASLGEFATALTEMIEQTPLTQLRSTLPPLLDRSRSEVASLLDLCLENYAPREDRPPFKIDYLITLLSRQRVGEIGTLRCDPANATPGLAARCLSADRDPDFRAPELSRLFRDARIELLEVDDLDEIVRRIRQVKGRLGPCLFDRDVLRAMVVYNIAAENRFNELFHLEHSKDAAIERTLHALSQLDMASTDFQPESEGVEREAPRGVEQLQAVLRSQLASLAQGAEIARRLAREIDPDVIDDAEAFAEAPRVDDVEDVLTRAAVLVGLALRDLPSLTARLRELDIDVSRVETDWVRELDEAVQAAIRALSKSGRSDQASRLARTRMRHLSGH